MAGEAGAHRVQEVEGRGWVGAVTKGEGTCFPEQVPPAQVPAPPEQGMSPVPPQPGGSCQRREGEILLSMAAPERMVLMGLKCIKADFG